MTDEISPVSSPDPAAPGDDTLRAWLLHRLDATAAERIEQRLFTDTGLADRIDALLADLYDDAARGRLAPADLRRLRRRDPARWRFARAFARVPRPQAATVRRPWFGRVTALAAMLLLAVFAWRSMPTRAPETAPIDSAGLPVAALSAEQSRGAQAVLVLPPAPVALRLQVEVDAADAATARYALRLADAAATRFEAGGLATRSAGAYRFVEVVIPSDRLGTGQRTVTLVREPGTDVLRRWSVQATAASP